MGRTDMEQEKENVAEESRKVAEQEQGENKENDAFMSVSALFRAAVCEPDRADRSALLQQLQSALERLPTLPLGPAHLSPVYRRADERTSAREVVHAIFGSGDEAGSEAAVEKEAAAALVEGAMSLPGLAAVESELDAVAVADEAIRSAMQEVRLKDAEEVGEVEEGFSTPPPAPRVPFSTEGLTWSLGKGKKEEKNKASQDRRTVTFVDDRDFDSDEEAGVAKKERTVVYAPKPVTSVEDEATDVERWEEARRRTRAYARRATGVEEPWLERKAMMALLMSGPPEQPPVHIVVKRERPVRHDELSGDLSEEVDVEMAEKSKLDAEKENWETEELGGGLSDEVAVEMPETENVPSWYGVPLDKSPVTSRLYLPAGKCVQQMLRVLRSSASGLAGLEYVATLAGYAVEDGFRVSHLIIPKQVYTGSGIVDVVNDCQVSAMLAAMDLVRLGWLKVQQGQLPTLESVSDLERQACYQLANPHSVALVCTPLMWWSSLKLTPAGMAAAAATAVECVRDEHYCQANHVLIGDTEEVEIIDTRILPGPFMGMK